MTDGSLINAVFGFRGRMRRSRYWLASIGLALARIAALIVALAITRVRMDDAQGHALRLVLDASFLWPSAAVVIKRGHDRNRSTLYSAVLIGAVYGLGAAFGYLIDAGRNEAGAAFGMIVSACWLYMLVDYGLLDGTKGLNRYGPSPKGYEGVGVDLAKAFD